MSIKISRRRGVSIVEAAIAAGLTFLLLCGMIVGALGVFRYQEVAYLAHEGARYASVRGTEYAKEVSGKPPPTSADIYDNAVKPQIYALHESKVSCTSTWSSTNSPFTLSTGGPYGPVVRHTVSVTVTYEWMPEIFFVGPINLSSTSTLPMSY